MIYAIESFPHLQFVFQMLVLISIGLILWQADTASKVDRLRYNDAGSRLFKFRRAAMFLKALSLVWMVTYSYNKSWEPWVPFIFFLLALDMYVIAHTLIMRAELARLRRATSERVTAYGRNTKPVA